MKCVLLSPKSDKAQVSPKSDVANPRQPHGMSEVPHHAFMHSGAILSIPATMHPRELILALRELERLAIEDYLRRTSDGGGT